MKNVLYAAALLLVPLLTIGQTDTIPKTAVLNGNKIRAAVNSNGLLFHDLETGKGAFTHDDYPDIPLIKSVGFWVGALDPGGNLKIAIIEPNEGGRQDFIPGYLDTYDFPGKDFNYIAKVKGLEIKSHLEDFNDNGVIDTPIDAIFSWPGAENPHFEDYTGMPLPDFTLANCAPFIDNNFDGVYNPMDGDFPSNGVNNPCYEYEIFPNELIWTTFHDLKYNPDDPIDYLKVTIQPTIFSYNCSQNEVSQNTVYVNYRIINNSLEDHNSLFFGLNVDFDLGCPLDDYLGVSPENESVYVYNSSEIDENCGDFSGLNELAPILLCDFAQGPLDENAVQLPALNSVLPLMDSTAFIGAAYPEANIEYYRNLSGSWRDGSPLEFGGDGYQEGTFPTNFIFPNNPNDSEGWSDLVTTTIPGNKNFVGSSGNFRMQPGDFTNVVYAFSVVQNTTVDSLYSSSYYDQYYSYWARTCDGGIEPCEQFTNTNEYSISKKSNILLYPNPTSNTLNIKFDNQKIPTSIRILDFSGKELWKEKSVAKNQTIQVDWLPAGVYFLEGNFENGVVREKFILLQE